MAIRALCGYRRHPNYLEVGCGGLLFDDGLETSTFHTSAFCSSAIMAIGRTPAPAYQATKGSILDLDKDFYTQIASSTCRELIESFEIPIRSGRAFSVPRGHVCRLSTPYGPQVGDLNLWARDNPRERFWASRTRQLHRSHVTTFDRLWSCLPYLRPMCTIVGDTLAGYSDDVGGRVHDVGYHSLDTPFSSSKKADVYSFSAQGAIHMSVQLQNVDKARLKQRQVNQMLSGKGFDFHCHSNLTRAILPFGLVESDVHDVLNVFQVTGLNQDGQYYMSDSLRYLDRLKTDLMTGSLVRRSLETTSNSSPRLISSVPFQPAPEAISLLGAGAKTPVATTCSTAVARSQ